MLSTAFSRVASHLVRKTDTVTGPETEPRRVSGGEEKEAPLVWTVKETDPLHRGSTRNRWFSRTALSTCSVLSTAPLPRR